MPPEESIVVAPSADNGNLPVDTVEAPSDTTTDPVVPADNKEPAAPAEPVAELFELPDGRKVDAQTLSKEWKDNFYPEYTRKSQALAEKENTKPEPAKPYEDPAFTPNTWGEAIKIAKDEAIREIEAKESARTAQAKALEDAVANQVAEIRKADSTLNENALFLHATKYGFRDLKQAHQNMKDMSDALKAVKQATAKDIAKRNDPVSISPGATGARPEASNFATAQDYLRALKASGK